MHRSFTTRPSRFPILPPYVLRAIAHNGTPSQRARAMQMLEADHTVRMQRAVQRMGRLVALTCSTPLDTEGQKQRAIFDAHQTQDMGRLVRSEGAPPTGDPAVDEAYDGLGATYDFFWEVYDRDSLDDHGLPLRATVHFGRDYDNAFWDGQRMVFGDGDGHFFNRFTVSLDVIGHELTHGITEVETQLIYSFESGALNESLSDVFGSLVKQWHLHQTADQADWLIGAGLFTPSVQGVALRSIKAPGTAFDDPVLGRDPQPADMRHFVFTFEDNGGVHINSGIPNHAFYLVAAQLGGYAWEKAGRIWYETVRDPKLRPNTRFRQFARLTVDAAGRLFGFGSEEQQVVRESWRQVGIRTSHSRKEHHADPVDNRRRRRVLPRPEPAALR
jgi:Zn-dependent metalloprotease